MLASLLRERDEVAGDTPHLSHSRVNRYLLCPRQYHLYYLERLRPKVPPAALVFGQIVHQAMAELFAKKADPVKHFTESWGVLKGIPLAYKERENWEKLLAAGERLIQRILADEAPRITEVSVVEQPFTLGISCLDTPFVGIIDLVAHLDGVKTVVDWKTAGAAYAPHEATLADQLTAYALAEPSAQQLAFCVLVKTKAPQVEWHCARRSGEEIAEYLAKVEHVAREISAGHFYKRPGMWCSWCDFLPVCTGDKRRQGETLVVMP